jgi:dsRNA-specific ribonuclease
MTEINTKTMSPKVQGQTETTDDPLTWVSMPTQHDTSFPYEEFRAFIQQLLRLSNLDKKYIHILTKNENMRLYLQAMTHPYFEPIENYEWFEMMGDAILNKCMVYYINHRYPFLHNHQGVKVIARLKINLVSKKTFADISCRLGLPKYIRFRDNLPKVNPKSLFEDVLESFFGVTEWLMDKHFDMGSGHVVCYRILKRIMDSIPISLKYEDLFDNITRLKETFDMYKMQLWGHIRYENVRDDNGQHVSIYQYCPQLHRKVLLYKCSGTILDDTKQYGAGEVIELLKQRGYSKPVPSYYLQLQKYIMNSQNSQNSQKCQQSPHGFLACTKDILPDNESPPVCTTHETNANTDKGE